MTKLTDILSYLCYYYPSKNHLSKARVTKIIYLADWKSVLKRDKQLTNIEWFFNHYGPYVDDIIQVAEDSPSFQIISTTTIYGNKKETIKYIGDKSWSSLTESDKEIIDEVIEETSGLFWNDFIKKVYATEPVKSQQRYNQLNLISVAHKKKLAN